MTHGRYPNFSMLLISLGGAVVTASVLSLCLGDQPLPVRQVVRVLFTGSADKGAVTQPVASGGVTDEQARTIVRQLRVPRTLLALLVGAGLAVSGMVMQGFFQNPMANPYLLGVSSGASLGATVGLVLLPTVGAAFGAPVAVLAFAGALLVTFVVYALSRVGGRTPVTTLLLTGIAVGSLAQALSAYIYIRRPGGMQDVILWIMGSFQKADGPRVLTMAGTMVVCLGVVAAYCRDLNVLLMGDEPAHHLGVEVARVRQVLLVVASLLAAASVAVVGVIGFIGLVVPHLMRLLTGPRHERLLPACVLGGGLLTLLADLIARGGWTTRLFGGTLGGVLPTTEIPIGIVTAFIGCPFFLYLLRRSKREPQ